MAALAWDSPRYQASSADRLFFLAGPALADTVYLQSGDSSHFNIDGRHH
jgi:hypothetical protein